ncbi:hypothetical protein [Halocatena marina]|uniref:hypothetical protein n=1 Tax=Halocatena marina TaxID=2934937 RepID=UPI00200BE4E4|nr:hypothetical protein [Halocatena marina]
MDSQKAILAALLIVGFIVTPLSGSARAPPQTACGVCTSSLDHAADKHGVSINRAHSELSIQVYENASTEWTATVRLTEGVSALQNDALRNAIVTDALHHARHVAEPTHVSSQISGDTLTVSYRDSDAVETHLGVLVFTRFHASDPVLPFVIGGEGTTSPGADKLVVRAPSDYLVTGDYASAAESKNTVRWNTNKNEKQIKRSTRITFVRNRGLFTGLRTTFARLLYLV